MYKTAILLRTKTKTTLLDLQQRLNKIRTGKGSLDQRYNNSKNMLLTEIGNINIIINTLTQNTIEIPVSLTDNVRTQKTLLQNLPEDLSDTTVNIEDIYFKISDIAANIADIYFKISKEIDISRYEINLYYALLEDLSQPIIDELKIGPIKTLLDLFSEIEYRALAFTLSKYENLKSIETTNFLKLHGYINQYNLDKKLSLLGFVNVAKFHYLSTLDSQYNRLIITTKDVLEGFDFIIKYLNQNNLCINDILKQHVSALDIKNYYLSQGIETFPSGFEIAWGIIDQLIKRETRQSIEGRTDKIFITTSFICAQQIIPLLEKNSTLVLDGHGSAIHCNFADKPSLLSADLLEEIKDLLKLDSNKNIDHILLQSCTSGTLKYTQLLATYIPKKGNLDKNRLIALASEEISANELFEQATQSIKMESLAALLFKALVELERSDIAFTFTEDLLCPGVLIGQGNVGVKKSSYGEIHTPWPDNIKDTDVENPILKSITIVLDPEHRKAGDTRAFFLHMALTKQNFRTLNRIRSSTSFDSYTTGADEHQTPISCPSSCFERSPINTSLSPEGLGFFSSPNSPYIHPEALKGEEIKIDDFRSATPEATIDASQNFVTPERIKKSSPKFKSADRSTFFAVLGGMYQCPQSLLIEDDDDYDFHADCNQSTKNFDNL